LEQKQADDTDKIRRISLFQFYSVYKSPAALS